MSFRPDPKPKRQKRQPIRVVDPAVSRAFLLAERECCACGRAATNAHHVVRRGSPHFGDDVVENLVPLCGSGTSGCHGAAHGVTSIENETAWTPVVVSKLIGAYLLCRPEKLDYVFSKLGADAGAEYLLRFFGVYSQEAR